MIYWFIYYPLCTRFHYQYYIITTIIINIIMITIIIVIITLFYYLSLLLFYYIIISLLLYYYNYCIIMIIIITITIIMIINYDHYYYYYQYYYYQLPQPSRWVESTHPPPSKMEYHVPTARSLPQHYRPSTPTKQQHTETWTALTVAVSLLLGGLMRGTWPSSILMKYQNTSSRREKTLRSV